MLSILTCTALLAPGAGSDWPQYNGPSSDRVSSDALGLRSFPSGGPRSVWRVPLADGFSSFTVAGGRAYTLVARQRARYGRAGTRQRQGSSGRDPGRRTTTAATRRRRQRGRRRPALDPAWPTGAWHLDAHLGLACFEAASGKPL
jgi:hypothetical protein